VGITNKGYGLFHMTNIVFFLIPPILYFGFDDFE
jgi:hypothetical protein